MKGDKTGRRSSFGSMVRRRLSDITNSLPQPKSPAFYEADNASANEYIDCLVKEKMALVKLIQEKNKIIELSGSEIKNLRSCLQKMQLQNWSLAQTNSHMLAEINAGKQRMKALEHEVACKDTLLRAKNLQLMEAEDSEMNEDRKVRNASRRRRHSRSASLGSSKTYLQQAEKETVLSKRRCVRRQSASTGRDHEAKENLLGLGTVNLEEEGGVAEERRTSMSRPSRKAVEKVRSYKEIPVNIKMRRSH